MKNLILILTLITSPLLAMCYDLKQVREEYYKAVKDDKAADKFYKKLKLEDLNDPLILAYYGSAEAVRAKHAVNPYNKISFLKSGLKNLAKAVNARPESLEIRFLRFSLEHYLPSFLGMAKELTIDRQQIVRLIDRKQLGTVDGKLLSNIVSFMKESKRCNANEIAILDKAI